MKSKLICAALVTLLVVSTQLQSRGRYEAVATVERYNPGFNTLVINGVEYQLSDAAVQALKAENPDAENSIQGSRVSYSVDYSAAKPTIDGLWLMGKD